eukprot:4424646-Pyramimonas_sp.AAC.1
MSRASRGNDYIQQLRQVGLNQGGHMPDAPERPWALCSTSQEMRIAHSDVHAVYAGPVCFAKYT